MRPLIMGGVLQTRYNDRPYNTVAGALCPLMYLIHWWKHLVTAAWPLRVQAKSKGVLWAQIRAFLLLFFSGKPYLFLIHQDILKHVCLLLNVGFPQYQDKYKTQLSTNGEINGKETTRCFTGCNILPLWHYYCHLLLSSP